MLDDVLFLDAVQYLLTIGLGALVSWLLAQLAPGVVRGLKDAWLMGREYVPAVVRAVDQPDDPLLRGLAQLGVPPDVASKLLPRVLRSVAEALDDVADGA